MNKKKSNKKRIIITVSLLLLLAILIQPLRAVTAQLQMSPLETSEISPSIYAISNRFVNLYLVKVGEKYIAFDAGVNGSLTKTALESLSINPQDVAALFLTHTDYDHVSGISEFPDATIYISKAEADALKASPRRSQRFISSIGENYKAVEENETINIYGASVTCIFTPGHTNGSCSYILNEKYLFAGDNLSLKNGQAKLFNSVFNTDNKEQEKSLSKLAALSNIEAVFTMHYGYTENFVEAFKQWKK